MSREVGKGDKDRTKDYKVYNKNIERIKQNTELFNYAFLYTLENEGYYSNDPQDQGGETKWGISKRSHPEIDIKNLTLEGAKVVYKKSYWNDLYYKLDSKELAIKLYDIGVNMGVGSAVNLLQIALNEYCNQNLLTDGSFGAKTLKACNESNYILNMFIFECSKRYESLSKRSHNKKFFVGWINRLYKPINRMNKSA